MYVCPYPRFKNLFQSETIHAPLLSFLYHLLSFLKNFIKVLIMLMIQITFISMRLESNCDHDYVLIRNGPYPSSPLINTYCGNNLPLPILSESSGLWIEFHSDDSKEDEGFELKLESVFEGELAVLYPYVLSLHILWVGFPGLAH